jgi:hypothetical protein
VNSDGQGDFAIDIVDRAHVITLTSANFVL